MKLAEPLQIPAILRLSKFFIDRCSDRSTLTQVIQIAKDKALWSTGHDLFTRIRFKTLDTEKRISSRLVIDRDHLLLLSSQYHFEEVCAKTIYNLSKASAPFDSNAPEWIVPNALTLGRLLGVGEEQLLNIAGLTK